MNAEIQAEWVKRLRSGKIPQTTGYLADGPKRCCLGVLCDMAVEAGVIAAPTPSNITLLTYDGSTRLPTEKVQDWAGITEMPFNAQGSNGPEAVQDCLSGLNDKGFTFDQIADVVEML